MEDRKLKVLIIRFNAIGDIVLTSPVIKVLHDNNYEIHYLVKKAFASILRNNPRVSKVWIYDNNFDVLLPQLKASDFDLVIDLHNNLRSQKVKSVLKSKKLTFAKPRIALWLLTKFGIQPKKLEHIVHRFLNVIKPLDLDLSHPKVEFYIENESLLSLESFSLPKKYITIAVGTAYETKKIPKGKILEVIKSAQWPVVLIGGHDDIEIGSWLEEKHENKIYNLCGQLTIEQSAGVIKNSLCLISGDTGMMHIAAALGVKVIAVFGSTHPILGYTPFYNDSNQEFAIIQNHKLKCRPCTKQGKKTCPKGHFKCMNDIKAETIIEKISTFV